MGGWSFYPLGRLRARLPGYAGAMRPALLPALALVAAACATRGTPAARSEPGFEPARARAEVAWLADPARTGRGVGTPGNAEAARWIAARFEEAGLVPAGEEGWFEPFEAPYRAVPRDGNALALGDAAPALGAGWQ